MHIEVTLKKLVYIYNMFIYSYVYYIYIYIIICIYVNICVYVCIICVTRLSSPMTSRLLKFCTAKWGDGEIIRECITSSSLRQMSRIWKTHGYLHWIMAGRYPVVYRWIMWNTIVLLNMAMSRSPFIDVFPLEPPCDSIAMFDDRRVIKELNWITGKLSFHHSSLIIGDYSGH